MRKFTYSPIIFSNMEGNGQSLNLGCDWEWAFEAIERRKKAHLSDKTSSPRTCIIAIVLKTGFLQQYGGHLHRENKMLWARPCLFQSMM